MYYTWALAGLQMLTQNYIETSDYLDYFVKNYQ